MLSEHDEVILIQVAARRDEEAAKRNGPEFYKRYRMLVREMEENRKNGIRCTYCVPCSYD